jgi:hypothetical protein
MDTNGQRPEPPDLSRFNENRSRFPPEDLLPYAGQHVAWSADGTRILAFGADMNEVERKLIAAGIAPNSVVFGYVDPPDRILL